MKNGNYAGVMMRVCMILLVAIVSGSFSFSIEGAVPSDRLREAIPDVVERLSDPVWRKRAELFEQLLVRRPGPGAGTIEFKHDLPVSDYELLLLSTLKVIRNGVPESEWRELMDRSASWFLVIKQLNLERVTAEIAELLSAESIPLRAFALEMLAALDARKHDRAVAALLASPDQAVRRASRDLLVRFESKLAVPVLLQELREGPDDKKYLLIKALGKIREPSAAADLAALGKHSDEDLRFAALEAVAACLPEAERAAALIPMARQIANASTKPHVVSYALAMLIRFGDAGAVSEAMTRLKSANESTCMSMLTALESVPMNALVPFASEALVVKATYGNDFSLDCTVREFLIAFLARAATPEVVEPLRDATKSENSDVQTAAIRALGTVGARAAVPNLINFLDGPCATEAAISLARIRDRRALEPLKAWLTRSGNFNSMFLE
ncbi:MAG: HEAT repeat domain-containing protein [Chthoniobacteraceae bacterium]